MSETANDQLTSDPGSPDEGDSGETPAGGALLPLSPAELDRTDPTLEEGPGEEPYVVLAEGSGVLVRSDPLSRYLADIRRFERLDADEEHALAVRYHAEGDREAARRLVTSHLRLVVSLALGFRRAYSNVLDLIQEGNVGLMEAVQRFDPFKGTRLSTYATFWIRSRMIRYLLDNWRLVRVGTTNARRKLLYNLRAEQARLEGLGITPTTKMLADNLGATQEDVVAVDQALGARDASLDAPLGDESGPRPANLLAGVGMSPEAEAAGRELLERLHAVLDDLEGELSTRERALLRERLLADDPVTLQELADREGVTREAVRQSERRLLDRLREHLRERLPEAADIRWEPGGAGPT